MSDINQSALALKALHKPGDPLVLANVYDIISARAVAALPSCKVLATASFAVARAADLDDDDMPFEVNFAAVKGIGKVAKELGKPLTVDMQNGYGDQLEEAIEKFITAGAAGGNLEDYDNAGQKMYPLDEAVSRIERAMAVARKVGVPNFVLNARCDALARGEGLDDVLKRGKAYLAAGASNVFVWGGAKRGVSREEVEKMVEAFDGRLNVSLKLTDDRLTVAELAKIGVARISTGPKIQVKVIETYTNEAEKVLTGGY